jgi:hypothetical protein
MRYRQHGLTRMKSIALTYCHYPNIAVVTMLSLARFKKLDFRSISIIRSRYVC